MVRPRAIFYLLDDPPILAKLIQPKRFPKDYLRRFAMQAEACRVFWGAVKLSQIGIDTPKPLGYSVMVNPCSRYESIYYAEYKAAYVTAHDYMRQICAADRLALVQRIACDYATMINQGLHYKDLHFGNVLLHGDRPLCWIDSDMRSIPAAAALAKKIRREMGKLKHRSSRWLTEDEWQAFQTTVAAHTHRIPITLL